MVFMPEMLTGMNFHRFMLIFNSFYASNAHLSDEPWEEEELDDLVLENLSRPLRFEDPELEHLVDHTQLDEYLTPALIRLYQRADPVIGLIRNTLKGSNDADQRLAFHWRTKIRKETIFFGENEFVMIKSNKIMVPAKLKLRIMEYFHSTNYFAHQGRDRMFGARFYWPNMHSEIQEFIKKCKVCCQVKGGVPKKKTLLRLFPSRYPYHMVAIDLFELPHSRKGYKHILTMIDRFSRYANAVPLKNSKSETVIRALVQTWIYKHGTPEIILSDNGQQFTSHNFRQFVDIYRIKHKRSTPYHPQSNGMIERFHRYLKQRLVIAAVDKIWIY
jgi:hypothetical protein